MQKQYETLVSKGDKRSALGQVIGAVEVGELMGSETCKALFECKEDFDVPRARMTCDGRGSFTFDISFPIIQSMNF